LLLFVLIFLFNASNANTNKLLHVYFANWPTPNESTGNLIKL